MGLPQVVRWMELNLVQKQTQTLSPLMMQSMEILQMGTQELMEFVDKTLQENPVLEQETSLTRGRGGRPLSAKAGMAGEQRPAEPYLLPAG